MSDYSGIHLPISGCIHFVRDLGDEDGFCRLVAALKKKGILCAYVDYLESRSASTPIYNYIARVLKLDNPPYGAAPDPWVPFLDDLITFSHRVNGLVLIVDNSDVLFDEARDVAFDLIESFLIQFHHWFEKEKPCHLCFQVEKSKLIRQVLKPP